MSKASKPSATELILQELMFLRSLDCLKDGGGNQLKKSGRVQPLMSAEAIKGIEWPYYFPFPFTAGSPDQTRFAGLGVAWTIYSAVSHIVIVG